MSGTVFFSGTCFHKGCTVFRTSFTHSTLYKRTYLTMLISLWAIKELNNLGNNLYSVIFRNSEQITKAIFCCQKQYFSERDREKFATFLLFTSFKLPVIQILFTSVFIIIIITIITIINRSSFRVTWLCRVHCCLPSSWMFSGICLYHSAASQLEPLFPHLFSLSPLMICSDRYDS